MKINNKVTVILTDFGKKIIDEHRSKLETDMKIKFDLTLSYDENGRYTTELSHLMFLFGRYMTLSCKPVFNNNEIHIN